MLIDHSSHRQSLVKKGLKANEWISGIQGLIEGRGGGKELSAQATGVCVDKIKEVVTFAHSYAVQKLALIKLDEVLPIKDKSQADKLCKSLDG